MVSSTVYGSEELLDRLYAVLEELGFEVWMSHKGTTPVDPMIGALESCQRAVTQCDLFLSLIFPSYGSGKNAPEDDSITHEELRYAIQLNKPRWVLVHEHVVVARNLLRSLGYKKPADRRQLQLNSNVPLDDLRIIDMYEMAMRSDIKEVKNRTGNWVQTAVTDEDALLFAISQFRRYQEAEAFVKENLGEVALLLKNVIRGEKKS